MIHGAGDQIKHLREYCKVNGINNIKFYGRIKKEHIPSVLTHADINFLSFQPLPLLKYGISMNKLFEYLASGKPLLSNTRTGYNLIEEYACGLITKDQSTDALANGILELYNMDIEQRSHMGNQARKAAEDYAQPVLVAKVEEVLLYALNKFK
jgi:glycosyltransferase involved in cell wall biosynthesis